MVNRFEATGIALSLGLLVLALWFVRLDSTNELFATLQGQNQEAATVVSTGEGAEQSVGDAIAESYRESGGISDLIIDDVVIGTGNPVVEGDVVAVHYIGTLQNGQQFDNSYLKGAPFEFTVGEGRVIEGWEKGVIGMQEGGQRILVIPSSLAYGDDGFGPIPGNATLVFAIELININE